MPEFTPLRICEESPIIKSIVYYRVPGKPNKKSYRNKTTNLLKKLVRFNEQDGRCKYCSASLRYADATIDHYVALGSKGSNAWTNKVVACMMCNQKKANSPPEHFLNSQTIKSLREVAVTYPLESLSDNVQPLEIL